ncbi:MAG: TraR/DksA family transcriptional regulator [Candidatus Gygaella obscura]|nr:TraR/DksA family transcriptional regulator [Candidatus Gygaella obscura]
MKQFKMNKADLKKHKEILLKRKEEIVEQIEHISRDTLKLSQKDASGDISGYAYHMADLATDSFDREFSLGLASNERQLLYEINDALRRVEDGSFGKCSACDKPIPKTRLKAIPYSKLCLKCQKLQEKS